MKIPSAIDESLHSRALSCAADWAAQSAAKHSEKSKKQQSLLAGLLLQYALFYGKGINPSDISIGVNAYGKPCITNHPNLFYSVSHCSGLVACALSNVQVGIDVENIRPFNTRIASHICTENELNILMRSDDQNRCFFRYWTLKESYGKAIGVGVNYPMKEIEFKFSGRNVSSNVHHARFILIEQLEGFVAAVCYLTRCSLFAL